MIYTTTEAARALGITPRRVRALAISRRIGERKAAGWLFTEADLDTLRVRVPGHPKKEDPPDEVGTVHA